MIRLHDLIKLYQAGEQDVHALDGVSLHIRQGEFVAIMGASGSGKSTLMNIIGCLDQPSEGNYTLDGEEISRCDDATLTKVRNRKLGFVFQNFNLLPRMSAVENVELPMIYAGVAPKERRDRATAALTRVGLGQRMTHRPNELSGGQQQRVAIARAMVNEPKLLLADEPTGALDSRTSEEIMDLFGQLNAQGMTIILVTHEADIAEYAHRVIRLRDGKIVADERKGAVFTGEEIPA